MDIVDWIPIAVLMFGGGGFWIWVRKLSVEIAALKTWVGQIDKRQDRQTDNMNTVHTKIGDVHERIDELVKCTGEKDSETAKAVGRLEGKMDALLDGKGKV